MKSELTDCVGGDDLELGLGRGERVAGGGEDRLEHVRRVLDPRGAGLERERGGEGERVEVGGQPFREPDRDAGQVGEGELPLVSARTSLVRDRGIECSAIGRGARAGAGAGEHEEGEEGGTHRGKPALDGGRICFTGRRRLGSLVIAG